MENKSNINRLLQCWPDGTVAVQQWLATLGISPLLTNWYLKSGWVESVGRGAYKRVGDTVNWTGGLYAIQRYLKKHIHVGAKTALELLGRTHFVRLGKGGNYYFFGEEKTLLPTWFGKNNYWNINVVYLSTSLFSDATIGVIEQDIDGVPIYLSSPERAIMEVLYLIPKYQSLEEAYLLIENLGNMRPKHIQALLENCNSIKVKRLFMHLSELCAHPYVKYLDVSRINFGHGKRVIAGGGVYHHKYQLSLPELREIN